MMTAALSPTPGTSYAAYITPIRPANAVMFSGATASKQARQANSSNAVGCGILLMGVLIAAGLFFLFGGNNDKKKKSSGGGREGSDDVYIPVDNHGHDHGGSSWWGSWGGDGHDGGDGGDCG